jgi:hypothetical protein
MPKPPDRVQLLKQEIAADGGDPLDNEMGFPSPVESEEDAIQAAGFFLGEATKPAGDELVGGYRESDELILFDSGRPLGVNLKGLLTPAEHKTLRQGIHFIDGGPAEGFASGAYRETLPAASPFPTSVIWYESAAKLKKIVALNVTRNPNKSINVSTWLVYDTDGSTVLATIADTLAYSGIFETSRTRAIT